MVHAGRDAKSRIISAPQIVWECQVCKSSFPWPPDGECLGCHLTGKSKRKDGAE